MDTSRTAFELLLTIDQRCRQRAANLPTSGPRVQTWSGIGFRLAQSWYVAPLGEIVEVLHEPRATTMPGVKPWVVGVANLRGRLLPLMDLCGYFGHELSAVRKQRRVLVVDTQDIYAGLVVDEVCGLQHFALHSLDLALPAFMEPAITPYIQGHFHREQAWSVFSPFAWVQSSDFRDVAL